LDARAIADAQEITAVDHGIIELKDAVENMHAKLGDIQRRIDE
jgi:hypothetical protein